MATDTEQLVLSISADTAQIRRALARLTGDTRQATNTIEGEWTRVDRAVQRTANTMQQGGQRIASSMREVRAATTNLGYQLNDIAQGLASGVSPFTIIAQQGTQVTQAIRSLGGATNVVRALGSAFAGLINPVSLATFAVIGLAGAAVEYFTSMKEEVPDADALLKQHEEAVSRLKAAWEEAGTGLGDYVDTMRKRLASADVQKELETARASIASIRDAMVSDITGIGQSEFEGATAAMQALLNVLAELNKEADQIDFGKVLDELGRIADMKAPDAIKEFASALADQAKEAFEFQKRIAQTNKEVSDLIPMFDKVTSAIGLMTQAMTGINANQPIDAIAEAITSKLLPAVGNAIDAFKQMSDNIAGMQGMVNQTTLGAIPPVFSGGGQFLNPEELQRWSAQAASSAAVLETAAAKLIQAEEGFIDYAKYDVNAWRTGFGSDTFVDQMGRVQRVTKDTRVTVQQALADLARRIPEFQAVIMRQIGPEMWKSLNEAQQAALSSIAYNYGRLPDSIVAAIRAGGGPEKVAAAIAALDANPARRKREAEAYGGGFYSAREGTARQQRTPEQIFSQDMQKTQQNIAMLQAQYDAMAKLGPAVEDYGYQVAYATEKQRLLNEAQRAGVTVTPELEAQIDGLAQGYAKASANVDQLKSSQQNAAQAAQQFGSMAKDFLSGFISDLRNGKSATEALANALGRLADQLLDMALNMLFSNLFGGGGGGLFGGFAKGGVVGRDTGTVERRDPMLWNGARRMQSGGVVGLRPGEVPIIAHRGELIVPKAALMRASGSSSTNATYSTTLGDVQIDMSKTGAVAADAESAKEFGIRVQKAVQMIMVQESRPGGLLRRPT